MLDRGGEHFVILGWGERSENDEGECFSQSLQQIKLYAIKSLKGSSPVLKEALVSKCSEQEEIPFKKILEKVGNVSFFSRVEREVSNEKKYPVIDSIREHEVFSENTIFQFVVHMQYWTPSFKTAPQRRPTCVTKWALESGAG